MSEVSNAVHRCLSRQGLPEKKCYIGEEEADETYDSDNDGENTFS